MKVYYGHAATDERTAYVTVREKGHGAQVLPHHVHHSPSGFNWGYGGAGPSELARCLLFDAFGAQPCPSDGECRCDNKWAEAAYPAYRDAVVANLEQTEDWKIDQTVIVDWVFDYLKAVSAVEQQASLVST